MKKIILSLQLIILSISLFSQSLQDGIKAFDNERFNQAEGIFKSLVGSTNAEAAYYLGKLYYTQGKLDQAKSSFEKGISINPKFPSNYAGLGLLLLDDSKPEEARKQFDIAFDCVSSKDPKAGILVGEAYSVAKKNDLSQAITYLTRATTIDKKNYDAQIALGDAYVQKPDGGGAAMTAYETAMAIDPTKPLGYLRKGDLFFKAKNYELSIETYKQGREKDSSFAPIHRDLGEIYYLAKRYDLAVKSYEKFLTLTEPTLEYRTRMAYFYFFNKQYDKATEYINKLKNEDPDNNILNRLLGYGFVEQAKYSDAITYLVEFFKKSEPSKILPSDYEYLGRAYLKSGNDSLAEINILKTVHLDSSKTDLLMDLGKSYQEKKRYPKAAAMYKLKTTFPHVKSIDWFKLGQAYYFGYQGAKTDTALLYEADSAFMKVVELSPTAYLGYNWRAMTNSLIDTKLTTLSARPLYEKVIEICSTDKVKFSKELLQAYKYIGYTYIQKDDNAIAKDYYIKALEVNPEDAEAKKNLELINNSKKK